MVLEVESIRYAHGSGHTDICYGNDNSHIFSCGSDGFVRIWNGPDDDDSHSDFVADQALSVACKNDYYYVATNNNYVQAYTYADRKKDKIIFRFSAPVTHVTVSCNGKFIAAGSCDMEIQVLDTTSNKITTFSGHSAPILGIALDPLNEYFASSSCDGSIKIWSLQTHSLVKTFSNIIPVKNDFFKAIVLGRCAWKSMSGLLLAIPKNLIVVVYKRNTWELVFELSSNNIEKELSAVLFSPCGNYVAGGSTGGEIVIWEIKHQSEVCSYKEVKKVGFSGLVWHPGGSKILFSDRLGRLGVITGLNEEIGKHSVPKQNELEIGQDYLELSEDVESSTFLNEDEDEDEENCISLEKIKSAYKNSSDDENELDNPKSPNSTSEIFSTIKGISMPELQSPFQPSSTPKNFEPRCLCYNEIGMIRYYNSDKTIDIQFHDTTFHHSLFLRSFGICTMAVLSHKVLCLAVPALDDNLSKLTCICLSSWAGNKEWTIQMPKNENIVAIAASGLWVAAATSNDYLRIFTYAGIQKQILSLPGPVVCMAGFDEQLFVVCHLSIGLQGSQNLGFIIYQISNIYVKALFPFQSLSLSPKSLLKWIGFSDEGTPCTFDSEGIIRLLGSDSIHWMIVSDMKFQRKSISDNYFVLGLNEINQNVRCIFCKNSVYPLVINSPTIVEIPLKMPMCELDDPKSNEEEVFWRLMFSFRHIQKFLNGNDMFKNFELPMQQAILKLFGEACNKSDDLRAVDLAYLMAKKPLDIAIQYASSQGKTYLLDKIRTINPSDWNHYLPSKVSPINNSNFDNGFSEENYKDSVCGSNFDNGCIEENYKAIDSQQDLFEDYPDVSKKASEKEISFDNSTESQKKTCINPFKKSSKEIDENVAGLKYLTSTKHQPQTKKGFSLNQPLKLKLPFNKEKNVEKQQIKKPTFFEWFSKKKEALCEEYSNVTTSELTKLGMKIYKEEMTKIGAEEKILEIQESTSFEVGTKRSCEEDHLLIVKKSKSLDESS